MKTTRPEMTAARKRILVAVESGALRTAQSGIWDGNIVHNLVDAGVLAAIRTFVPAEIMYHGRRIAQAVVFSQIKIAK